jgi:hypothetical protein
MNEQRGNHFGGQPMEWLSVWQSTRLRVVVVEICALAWEPFK